jgi:thiamine biosynthesis lipoprotein
MGCVYMIVVYGHDPTRLREAVAAALDEVDRIDLLMSHYKNDSELSRVNREAAKAPVKVDPELFDFIAECLRYSRESEGAFDITVGPLMKAWGFFRGEGRMPSEAELGRARNSVGYQHVTLNQKDGTIFFDKAGVELDMGGIAKGYAVDRAVAVLKRCGVTSALLSAGGSTIYAMGAPPGKPAWEIEVQDPVERNKIATKVRLKDRALSVSGSHEKFFEINGARYSHVMDPRTGWPVQGVLSVAVITGDGMSGDALDNVFYVLGAEHARAWLSKFSASEVIFFLPDQGRKWKMVHISSQTSAAKEGVRRKKLPTDLVKTFFTELCSKGCSDEEKTRWRENFRWEPHDLNRDSIPEYFLYIDHADWCGAGGSNCQYWVYQKTKSGYKLLIEDARLRPLKSYTNGYRDLASEHRIGASIVPCHSDYSFTRYKFDGRKYQPYLNKIIQKRVRRC